MEAVVEQSVTLLMLPVELKLKIFNLLNGYDKLQLTKVCKAFEDIAEDRILLQSLSFKGDYRVTIATMKLCFRKPICEYITCLNMNGIYWIPSAQMRHILLHFNNVTTLNVINTQISYIDLAFVLNTKMSKILKLAFSLRSDSCSDSVYCKLNTQITHLFITYNSHSMSSLTYVLKHFTKLKELWMFEPRISQFKAPVMPTMFEIEKFGQVHLKVTKKLVVTRFCSNTLSDRSNMINTLKASGNWLTLIDESSPIFIVLEKFDTEFKMPSLSLDTEFDRNLHFLINVFKFNRLFKPEMIREMVLKKQSYADTNFDAINLVCGSDNFSNEILDNCIKAVEVLLLSKNMRWLHTIRLQTLQLLSKKDSTMESALFKRRRVVHAITVTPNNLLKSLTEHCVDVQEFELINDSAKKYSKDWFWQPDCLLFLSRWKVLRKLVLTSVRFKNGDFLVQVAKNCKMLECLKIKDTFFEDRISTGLCDSLQFTKNLKDLRYERVESIPMDLLFTALSNCHMIERLFVQCKMAIKISKSPLENLLSKSDNLVFFFVYISSLPETICKSIRHDISKFCVRPQQFFKIYGYNYCLDNVAYQDISNDHIEDMIFQTDDFHDPFIDSY